VRRKLLSILIISILVLVAPTLVGCSQASSTPSTLTILTITEGSVFVMKAGTDSWVEAQAGMSLEPGDSIKTGDDSGADITFFDGSTIELQAGTEIEVVTLDISTDTGSTTITLQQTIGTTISRVTKLLDPASRYEIETPDGVAAVRGSVMIVQVTETEDGTTLITKIINQEGDICAIANGVELQIPEGRTCIIISGQPPELIPLESPEEGPENGPIYIHIPGGGFKHIVTDLAIAKSDSSDPVDPSTNLIYTLQITNNGPSDSTGAVVLDFLPSGVSFVSATNSGTYDSDIHIVSWAIGALAKDASTSVNITVKVNESTPAGIITNSAIVVANENDFYSANDIATEDTTINIVNHPPVAVDDSAITNEDTPITIDVLYNDSDVDGDTLTVDSVTQGANGSVTHNSSNVTYTPDVSFNGTDSFTYTISDGNGGGDTATVTVTITNTLARINVTIDTGPTASIFIWDDSTKDWAIDEDTQKEVDGTNHETSAAIMVAGGRYYYVWVEEEGVIYDVKKCPKDWIITSAPVSEADAAYGFAASGVNYPVHFTIK